MPNKIKEWDDLPTVQGYYWQRYYLRESPKMTHTIIGVDEEVLRVLIKWGPREGIKYHGPLHPPEDENEACGRFEAGERTNGGCQGNGHYFCRKCSELDPDSDMLKE